MFVFHIVYSLVFNTFFNINLKINLKEFKLLAQKAWKLSCLSFILLKLKLKPKDNLIL